MRAARRARADSHQAPPTGEGPRTRALPVSLRERFEKLVESLEETPIGPAAWCVGFLGIVGTRHLLEIRSAGFPLYPPSAFYVHYVLAYLAPLLALCLVLSLFSGVDLERVLRLMLLAWGLTLLPPFVDMLVARGGSHDARIGYLELGDTPWWTVAVHFFDPTFVLGGTTTGIRVETAVSCVLGATYVLLRARAMAVARALGAALSIFVVSLLFFTAPFLVTRLLALVYPGLTPGTLYNSQGVIARPSSLDARSDQGILLYLVPLTLALGAASLARIRPALLRRAAGAMVRSEGWAWAVAAGAGALAGLRILGVQPGQVLPYDRIAMIAGPLALLLAGGAASLFDPVVPKEAGAARALASGGFPGVGHRSAGSASPELASEGFAGVGFALLAAAACLALACSVEFTAFASIALAAGLLARGLPFYLPRAFPAPQAIFGVSLLAAFVAGYSFRAGDEALTIMPGGLVVLACVLGSLADLPRASSGLALRWRSVARTGAALTPILCVAIASFSLHRTPDLQAVGLAVVLGAGVFALFAALPPRLTTATTVLASGLVLTVLLASPDVALAWREQALDDPAYFSRASERARAAGKYDAAADAASETVRRTPDSALAHERLGMLAYQRGDLAGAVAETSKAAELDPRSSEIQTNLATILLKAGRALEGLAAADRAIAAEPGRAPATFVRAQCLDALGRIPEADTAWREYLRIAEGKAEEAPYLATVRQRLASTGGRR